METGTTSLWVFGYGSLCWNPGFEYKSSKIGHIKNYVRRFWQGNTTHRGQPGKPGRVATLVPEDKGLTCGVAFEIEGETALSYLNSREVELGGYSTSVVTFYSRSGHRFPCLLYIATPNSREWSGPASTEKIAKQILKSEGPSGHNVEYLLRLADFMNKFIPESYDEHLQDLERIVRHYVKRDSLCLTSLMGPEPTHVLRLDEPSPAPTVDSPPCNPAKRCCFTDDIPDKKLRCVGL